MALGVVLAVLAPVPAWADEADVVDVLVTLSQNGTYHFDVTVKHDDTGWDHFADAFEVLGPDEKMLGTRILAHPHVSEQPFTRSLGGVRIPIGILTVTVRAHDKVHGQGGASLKVVLPGRSP